MRRYTAALLLLLLLAGCGVVGGESKIEPSQGSGSPILNKDKAPQAPAAGQ